MISEANTPADPTRPIVELAGERLGIPPGAMSAYGPDKAKIRLEYLAGLAEQPAARLVLVTAMSPTPAGEGKTTTAIGLADGLARIGERALVALREPSLGPVFGMKGGATGGGRSRLVPTDEINLHFTGDFAAVAAANNLLSALIDNHVHHGNALGLDTRRIAWHRVLDMNDRALRRVVIGLGGPGNGFVREESFDIVAASEVMAILCLAESFSDLKARLARIVVGETRDRRLVRAEDLKAHGAMAALLRDALAPNLVRTLEGNPALVHGGPFANIAHGCSSVLATRAALRLADWTVTEAGFGADLGAEKFVDIKCRLSGIAPAVAVVVASVRALKFHGGVDVGALGEPDTAAIDRGMPNLIRHLNNLRDVFGLDAVVCVNRFAGDTDDEMQHTLECVARLGVNAVEATHWVDGGAGAQALARAVVALAGGARGGLRFAYDDALPLIEKARAVATRVYGAAELVAEAPVLERLRTFEKAGYGSLPVCVAKTPYSFSTDPRALGAPTGHRVVVREARLSAGAGFVVLLCGETSTMPGLPVEPAAGAIDIDAAGRIVGLQ